MNTIIQTIKQLIKKQPPNPLGRWNIAYCEKKTHLKVDLSNEDHCGPCGQYSQQKLQYQNPPSLKIPIKNPQQKPTE